MFSIIIPSRPCQTDAQTISPNQFAFTFPSQPHFSHVVVFILPGNSLPDGTAAAVYMQLPGDPEFRFLGAIANEKPSAIFKVNLPGSAGSAVTQDNIGNTDGGMAVDGMGLSAQSQNQNQVQGQSQSQQINAPVSLGISVEPIPNIQPQLAQLQQQRQHQQQIQTQNNTNTNTSTALVRTQNQGQPSTKILAQRIIKNAFNFLASFAGSIGPGGGVEVVPLKSFEEWWKKFERRVENDPGFLERDSD